MVAALADTDNLNDFEGQEVGRTTVQITNTGDGLSHAMAVEPQEFQVGDQVFMLVRTECTKVQFVADKDDVAAPLERKHTFKASGCTVLPAEAVAMVKKHLEDQEDRVKRAIERASGIQRLGDPIEDDDDLDDDDDETSLSEQVADLNAARSKDK